MRPGLFQSTLPRRERRAAGLFALFVELISIHAPAKGATGDVLFIQSESYNFNPRSREGSDITCPVCGYKFSGFQSTLPRRERRFSNSVLSIPGYFNPRSREGSDTPSLALQKQCPISIHAPAKGATLFYRLFYLSGQFQSTLPRRERHPFIGFAKAMSNFNPRSREGSDRRNFVFGSNLRISIHAPAKGATGGRAFHPI